jgi:hypothetical protein
MDGNSWIIEYLVDAKEYLVCIDNLNIIMKYWAFKVLN